MKHQETDYTRVFLAQNNKLLLNPKWNRHIREALLCWLHFQRVVKAIEIVEQPDRSQQLDNLAFIKVLAQLGKKLIVDGVGVAGNSLRQAQRGFFFFREVRALLEVGQIVDLIVSPTMPSCQDGV
jgi:hypothetical protein